jgi:hypothetical protein
MSPERTRIVAAAGLALIVFALGTITGHATAGRRPATTQVTFVDGIPLERADTRAGALAAADNSLALGSQSVEQNPPLFARLVGLAYAPAARKTTIAQAATLRRDDPTDTANYAAGGRAVAVIAARRLDGYSRTRATVTSWLGGFVWGPRLTPRQSWNLVQTTLRYEHGRWLVVSSRELATPAPVPSIVYVDGNNNQSSAFDTGLAGMTAPFYGAG